MPFTLAKMVVGAFSLTGVAAVAATVATTVVIGAGVGALISAVTGGDIGQGALVGAVGGAVGVVAKGAISGVDSLGYRGAEAMGGRREVVPTTPYSSEDPPPGIPPPPAPQVGGVLSGLGGSAIGAVGAIGGGAVEGLMARQGAKSAAELNSAQADRDNKAQTALLEQRHAHERDMFNLTQQTEVDARDRQNRSLIDLAASFEDEKVAERAANDQQGHAYRVPVGEGSLAIDNMDMGHMGLDGMSITNLEDEELKFLNRGILS